MKLWKICLFMLIPLVLFSQIYFWEDENGVKHYSSTPPPNQENVKNLQQKETASPEQVEQEKKALEEAIAEQETERNSGKFPKIVMYSARESELCQSARNFFEENRVPITEYFIEESEGRYKEYESLGGGMVPFILIGNRKMQGWSEETMRILLGMQK